MGEIEIRREVRRSEEVVVGFGRWFGGGGFNGLSATVESLGSREGGGEVTEKTIEKSTGGKAEVDLDKGEVRIKTEEGEVVMKGELPEDMPEDIPVYPGATVAGSWQMEDEESGEGFTLSLETKDEVSKVVAFYKERLPEEGWKIKGEFREGETVLLTIEKEERGGWVSIDREEGKTVIGLMIGESVE